MDSEGEEGDEMIVRARSQRRTTDRRMRIGVRLVRKGDRIKIGVQV